MHSERFETYVGDKRCMMFIDGENLTIRAQKIAEAGNIHHRQDVYLWFHFHPAEIFAGERCMRSPSQMVRSYYYTAICGGTEALPEVKKHLWDIGFTPVVFTKAKDKPAKGVDIALTKDMLSHAFLNNYDVAVLVAGDGDYVPLVQEVKRLGKIVCVAFFEKSGLNPALMQESDIFIPLDWRLEDILKPKD